MSSVVQNLATNIAAAADDATKRQENDALDGMLWIPMRLCLDIPVVGFTISDLLLLAKGSIVETACHHTSDVPLRVNGLLIGWTEFEVVGDRLAVRITEQA